MVRTKADAYTKASVKAPRKQSALKGASASTPKSGKLDRNSGGNQYFPRPTPAWQKPITNFFSKGDKKDKSAEKKSMPEVAASCSCANNQEPVPSCSKDDPELMEFMDSEVMPNEDDSNQDGSEMNPESASNDDSELDENAVNLDPVTSGGDSKLEVEAKNLNPVSDNGDSKLKEDAKNLESISNEDDIKNSGVSKDDSYLKDLEDVENCEPVLNLNDNAVWCYVLSPFGGKEESNNGHQDFEAIPAEVHQVDDSSNLSEDSGINAATIGVNASPNVNDDDQDSGCVDE